MGFPGAERFYSKLTHTSQSWLRTRTSLKMPSCKWCALPKSLTAHSDIRSQQNCPKTLQWRNEPIFNFCSALSSQFEASNNQTCRQASAHCPSGGRESPQSGHGHRGKAEPWCSPTGRDSGACAQIPSQGCRAGRWVGGQAGERWHTQTQQFAGLPATMLCCIGQWWQGSPLAGRDHMAGTQQAGTTRRSHEYKPAVGYPSRLTKGIMVISKYFWSLYKLSLSWWHFLSWNLEPKALSSWSAEDSQIAKYLVMDWKRHRWKGQCSSGWAAERAAAFSFGMDVYVRARSKGGLGFWFRLFETKSSASYRAGFKKRAFLKKQMGTILACPASDTGPISKWTPRTGWVKAGGYKVLLRHCFTGRLWQRWTENYEE